jgi:hypothetical protein
LSWRNLWGQLGKGKLLLPSVVAEKADQTFQFSKQSAQIGVRIFINASRNCRKKRNHLIFETRDC